MSVSIQSLPTIFGTPEEACTSPPVGADYLFWFLETHPSRQVQALLIDCFKHYYSEQPCLLTEYRIWIIVEAMVLGGALLEGLDMIVWAVVAALALVGEILTVSFFLLFFSVGALVALLMALLGLGVVFQVGGFVIAVVLSMAILRPALLHRISFRQSEKYVS